MGAQLHRIDDPRDALSKARRHELRAFAEANGVTEIVVGMPADLMRSILRQKGLTAIRVPHRQLGMTESANAFAAQQPPPGAKVETVDATADLARQFEAQRRAADPFAELGTSALRKACKDRGIKQGRGEKPDSLRAKLRAHANGQDAS